MNYKDYIKNGKLILPEGFNNQLYCINDDLTKLILPEGFNSTLNCCYNKLTELILPEGFNNYLDCRCNNLKELILPKGFNINNLSCDKNVKIYNWNEWLALERERKINLILDEL